jgi:hypothetical protein
MLVCFFLVVEEILKEYSAPQYEEEIDIEDLDF